WRHQLNIIVPRKVTHNGGLLFISSGRMQKENPGMPEWHNLTNDGLIRGVARIAEENQAVAAVIRQVPNQPVYGELVEDELISYTLAQCREDGVSTWAWSCRMVKSAVRGMDAEQEMVASRSPRPVWRFEVAGLSKRGWTT